MPKAICQELKESLSKIKSLKQELEQEFAMAIENKDKEAMKRVSEMKKEMEENMKKLKNLLEDLSFQHPELVKKSINRIKEKLHLDIEFEINDKAEVKFKDAEEKFDQIIAIITYRGNRLSSLNLYLDGIGENGAIRIAQALEYENNKLSSLNLYFNNIGDDGAKEIRKIAESLSKAGREIKLSL